MALPPAGAHHLVLLGGPQTGVQHRRPVQDGAKNDVTSSSRMVSVEHLPAVAPDCAFRNVRLLIVASVGTAVYLTAFLLIRKIALAAIFVQVAVTAALAIKSSSTIRAGGAARPKP